MKSILKLALIFGLLMCISAATSAGRARKLPPKAYIASAKIEILGYADSKDPARIQLAMAMLDSLFMYYGPHSEGYFWYSQIQWDLASEQSDLKARLPLVQKAVAYADSLKGSCDNKDIKKKYRDKCKELSEEMDSVNVAQWREYYNAGVAQLEVIKESAEALKVAVDSTEKAWYQSTLDALVDSCQDNMTLAITVDSTDDKPFIGLATIYEQTGDYAKAIGYLERAADKSDNRDQIVISIAYDYIQTGEYCKAIPWFQEYVDTMTAITEVMDDPSNRAAVLGNAHNLAICLNNCKRYDEAAAVYRMIVSFDAEDFEAQAGIGRYFRQLGRDAADSARACEEAGDSTRRAEFMNTRDEQFDSSRYYLGQAFEINPDDASLAAEYGLMAAILEKYEEAKVGFARAAELKPGEIDYWISLGDCSLSMKEWADAANAYEKVVELDPSRKNVWEQLEALYLELGNKTRRAEVKEKLKSM